MIFKLKNNDTRHWKLMTVMLAGVIVIGFLFIAQEFFAAGVAAILAAVTLTVQWLCIDPPFVDDSSDTEGMSREPPTEANARPTTDEPATLQPTWDRQP